MIIIISNMSHTTHKPTTHHTHRPLPHPTITLPYRPTTLLRPIAKPNNVPPHSHTQATLCCAVSHFRSRLWDRVARRDADFDFISNSFAFLSPTQIPSSSLCVQRSVYLATIYEYAKLISQYRPKHILLTRTCAISFSKMWAWACCSSLKKLKKLLLTLIFV